jgi:hypothetical protein
VRIEIWQANGKRKRKNTELPSRNGYLPAPQARLD